MLACCFKEVCRESIQHIEHSPKWAIIPGGSSSSTGAGVDVIVAVLITVTDNKDRGYTSTQRIELG